MRADGQTRTLWGEMNVSERAAREAEVTVLLGAESGLQEVMGQKDLYAVTFALVLIEVGFFCFFEHLNVTSSKENLKKVCPQNKTHCLRNRPTPAFRQAITGHFQCLKH